ncbi:MAG: sulfite exporter TauE/SafE family protein [Ruminococcus sp.]|nr:sulfite exporter TauE/SafE family protein [Ruminococcus sp.]
MKKLFKKYGFWIVGILTGIANGLFGSGGGILAVPLLKYLGLDQKKAQATSISITAVLSVASLTVYLSRGSVSLVNTLKYIPFGLLGALVGSQILKKINPDALKVMFAIVLIITGLRLMFR